MRRLPASGLLALALVLPAVAGDAPIPGREGLNALLWMQTAQEYAFSTLQVYAQATRALGQAAGLPSALVDPDLPDPGSGAPPAIVLDLDETVLATSRYGADLTAAGRRHAETAWEEWVGRAPAEALAGALDFLHAAKAGGYRLFYVTNRGCPERERPAVYPHPACPQRDATLAQARRLGLPGADDPKAFLFRGDQAGWESGDKSPRRRFLAAGQRVVMLLGDDLGDFLPRAELQALRASRAADRPVASAVSAAPAWAGRFGRQWFLLPNPSYGSWETALAPPCGPEDAACAAGRLESKYRRLIPTPPGE